MHIHIHIHYHIMDDMCRQKWWSEPYDDIRCSRWTQSADARTRCVRSGNCNSQIDPLLCFRDCDTGATITPYQWSLYIRFRLGVHISDSVPASCPGCTLPMDSLGDHALSCKALGVYGRHNGVRNALAALFADSGCRVHIEATAPDSLLRPADVLVHGFEEQPSAIDLAVVPKLQLSSSFATVTSASLVSKVESRKRDQFSRLHRQLQWTFSPFVVSTMGNFGRSATHIIRRLVKLRALRSSAPPSDESGFCWEYVTSCIVHAVSRQLERAFPRRGQAVLYQGNATTPRDRPEEDEVSAHTDGFGNNTATLFVHQPYAALRSPAEDETRG